LPAAPCALPAVRRLFLERLQAAYTAERLRFSGTLDRLGDADAFTDGIQQLRRKNWVVYAKPPFGSPEHVLAYLGATLTESPSPTAAWSAPTTRA
jgi:hypothetical protein